MLAFPKAFSRQARTMMPYLLFFYISLRLRDSQEILSAHSALELFSNHFCVLPRKGVSCFELEFEIQLL